MQVRIEGFCCSGVGGLLAASGAVAWWRSEGRAFAMRAAKRVERNATDAIARWSQAGVWVSRSCVVAVRSKAGVTCGMHAMAVSRGVRAPGGASRCVAARAPMCCTRGGVIALGGAGAALVGEGEVGGTPSRVLCSRLFHVIL